MDGQLWAKRWHNKSWKMAEPNCRHTSNPIIISGQGNMVCWLVGGKCDVPDHPRWTLDSPRHFQTSKGTNTNNFPVNQNHPRRPQTPLTELQKIQDFDFFWNPVRGVLEGFGLIQKWFVLAQTDVGRVWKCLFKSKRSKVVVSYLAKEGRESGWKQSGSRSEASGDAWDGFGW